MVDFGPGSEERVKGKAYKNTDRLDSLESTTGARMRGAMTDMNSDSKLGRFDVDAHKDIRAPIFKAGPGVSPQTAQLDQGRTDAALGTAAQGLTAQGQTRGMQQGQLGFLDQMQKGLGPSVGALTAQAGAGKAHGLMNLAGSQAAQAMMQSQAGAGGQYGQAMHKQGMLTRGAAQNAGFQLQDANQDALRAQAAMAASARGGMQGAALLNAQNNVAGANQRASIDAGRMMSAANMQASDLAAASMMSAQQADLQARLQAGGALERGNINAVNVGADMMLEGARLRSGEQIQAAGMMTGALGDIRGDDLVAAQTGNAIAGTALAADNAMGDMDKFNAGLNFEGQRFNVDDRFRYDQLNSGNILATNDLNVQDAQARDLANQMAQLAARGIYGDEARAYLGMGIQQENEEINRGIRKTEFDANQTSHGLDRGANVHVGAATNSTQLAAAQAQADAQEKGALVSAGGTILAGLLSSDIRAKKNIRPAGSAADAVANFRKAQSYEYEYKDPKSPGAGRGKYTGPMAQHLPKGVTVKMPDGKVGIDPARLSLLSASAIGEQQKRLDKLERKVR